MFFLKSLSHRLFRGALVCAIAVLVSACGGHHTETPQATLAASVSELALAARNPSALPNPIPGTARVITVTNTSTDITAQDVAVGTTVVLPAGTTIAGHCGTLAPRASCQLTLTPGLVATTAPVALNIRGSNTNALAPTVQVLGYGSAYQGGYVFALDDTTPNTGSVGGKVAAKRDLAVYVPWSTNDDVIAGVDESATTPCNGAQDGACNTQAILAHYGAVPVDPLRYAAGQCASFIDEGYSDWYLPSVCEMGVGDNGTPSGCGTSASPRQQNIFTNLVHQGDVGGMVGSVYWTSTYTIAAPPVSRPLEAWAQYYPLAAVPGGAQSFHLLYDRDGVNLMQRCVRAITR